PHRQEQIGGSGVRNDAGVLNYELGPTITRLPDVAGGDREGLGDVGAGGPDDIGVGDVAPRVRVAIDPQRLVVATTGRDHAVTAVVVEVRGAQGQAREFADQVALLVG